MYKSIGKIRGTVPLENQSLTLYTEPPEKIPKLGSYHKCFQKNAKTIDPRNTTCSQKKRRLRKKLNLNKRSPSAFENLTIPPFPNCPPNTEAFLPNLHPTPSLHRLPNRSRQANTKQRKHNSTQAPCCLVMEKQMVHSFFLTAHVSSSSKTILFPKYY